MLSRDLALMEEWWTDCLAGRREFTAEAAECFSAMLSDARERAHRLERLAVVAGARAPDAARIGRNVVIFPCSNEKGGRA